MIITNVTLAVLAYGIWQADTSCKSFRSVRQKRRQIPVSMFNVLTAAKELSYSQWQ